MNAKCRISQARAKDEAGSPGSTAPLRPAVAHATGRLCCVGSQCADTGPSSPPALGTGYVCHRKAAPQRDGRAVPTLLSKRAPWSVRRSPLGWGPGRVCKEQTSRGVRSKQWNRRDGH